VTGASRGIGRAVAIALAKVGAAVAVNYKLHPQQADAVCREIQNPGGRADPHRHSDRRLRGLGQVPGVPLGGPQVGGEDFGEEPGTVRQPGRGDPGWEEAVFRMQAVTDLREWT
jgi:NAD(P)-dependent dehydrogenase (short-subunit alcohol dehydrogenase family)